ncbi:MAG: sensor histidine kinase [Promethearchaeota archaeon]|jgi:PAS domain S-box-containing protein
MPNPSPSKEIKNSKEKLQVIINHIRDIIIESDLNGIFLYVSPQVYDILGYKPEEVIGINGFKFIHPEDLPILASKFQNLIKTGGPVQVEYRVLHKDGHYVHFSVKGTVVKQNRKIKLIAILRDISLQKETEEKYKLITENSQNIVYSLDMNLNNTYISPSVYTVLGYDVDEALLMHPRDNTNKEDLGKIAKIYREEFKKERKNGLKKDLNRKRVFNIREKHKDGRILTMEHTISWLCDKNGIPVGILGVARDITKKETTEKLLKESEEKYRNLFENSPHAVGLINSNGVVIQGNSNIEKIFGYKKEEIIGQNFSKFPLFSKEHNVIVLKSFNKLIKGEIPEPQELQLHKKDGSIIWVSMQASIVKLKSETLFQVITQDISKIKEVEKKLEEQNKELQELNELKTEFLTRASHELKTPLTTIKGNADLVINLHHENLKPEVITMLEIIQKDCVRLEDIVHKLIESSKLETSKIELHRTKEDLLSFFKLCLNEVQTLAKIRNLTINLDIKPFTTVMFNKDQIHEVISNLLSNSIKYSPPKGIIDINSEIKGETIIISIKDQGIGFTKDEKVTIFQKFGKINRVSQGLDVISEGSGLGLYIAKKIVELHGGEIWVESEGRNKGSIFYFTLPII